jgi:hypothetical protein
MTTPRDDGTPHAAARPAGAAGPILAVIVAVALVGFFGVSVYAWLLGTELAATRESAVAMGERIETLRTQLMTSRTGTMQAGSVGAVLDSADLARIELRGPGDASGRAFTGGAGLLVRARHLPQPAGGRTYQVWITPRAGAQPVSVGVFAPDPAGALAVAVPLPSGVAAVQAVALTDEPSGGSAAATTAPVLSGQAR